MWLRPHGLKRCSTVLCVLRDSNISELRARLTRARPGAGRPEPAPSPNPEPHRSTFTTTALRICDVHAPPRHRPARRRRHVASMTRALSTLHSSIFFYNSYLLIERRFDGQRPWSTCVPDQCFAAARKPTSNEPTKQNLISVSTSHLSGVARSCDHQRTVHAS